MTSSTSRPSLARRPLPSKRNRSCMQRRISAPTGARLLPESASAAELVTSIEIAAGRRWARIRSAEAPNGSVDSNIVTGIVPLGLADCDAANVFDQTLIDFNQRLPLQPRQRACFNCRRTAGPADSVSLLSRRCTLATPETGVLRGGEVHAHQRGRPRPRRGKQRSPGASQPAGVQQGNWARRSVSVPTSIQPNSPCGGDHETEAPRRAPGARCGPAPRPAAPPPARHGGAALPCSRQQKQAPASSGARCAERTRAAWCRCSAAASACGRRHDSRCATAVSRSSRSPRHRPCGAGRPAAPAAWHAAGPARRRCRPRRW